MNILSIAVTVAAAGIDIRICFTYKGILYLKKDFMDYIGDETDMWILRWKVIIKLQNRYFVENYR